jgi:deoxyribonuclease-4
MEVTEHPLDSKGRCIIGAHTSAAGGAYHALEEGVVIDASGVQLFTANQRQWVAKDLAEKDIQKFHNTMTSSGVSVNMSHGSYLVNLGGANAENLAKSRAVFKQELERCHQLGIHFLVFHPGSAADSTVEKCLATIAESLIDLKDTINKGPTQVLIESTAGQGEQTGHDFAHLRTLMDLLSPHMKIGICLDTCHMFGAGYDLRTAEAFDKTFQEFDSVVGLKYLKAFHVNDSLSPLNSRVDRHAMLGEGHIGWLAFKLLMTDPRTALVPKYLETPGDLAIWTREIAQLRAFVNGADLPPNVPSAKMKSDSGKLKKARSDSAALPKKAKGKRKAPAEPESDLDDDVSDQDAGSSSTKKGASSLSRSKSSSSKPATKKTKEVADSSDDPEPCSHG